MKTIQEFSDDELVGELMERFDDIVVGARRVLTYGNKPDAQRRRWWKGDMDACIGLSMSVTSDLINKVWGVSQDDIRY